MEDPGLLLEGVKEAYEKAGWLGLAAAVLMLGVRLYKLDVVQQYIPAKYQWQSLGLWGQRSVVFGSSFAATALAAALGGLGWASAGLSAIPVALAAMLAHKVTRVAGSSLNGVLIKIPLYQGSGVQKMVGVVLPTGEARDANPPSP